MPGYMTFSGAPPITVTHPEVASGWHPTMNGDRQPDSYSRGSGYRAHWQCPFCGHQWQATVVSRTRPGAPGCPGCAERKRGGRRVRPGENDLASQHPGLASQWDPDRNGDRTPETVSCGSGYRAHWQCPSCGHRWQATVLSRAKLGAGCPRCAVRRRRKGCPVVPGKNDLASQDPLLAAQWHPTKNGGLRADQVRAHSSDPVWWLCPACGYERHVAPKDRGRGCAVCCGRLVVPGINDLCTTYPELAAEWHPARNAGLLPTQVTRGSAKPAWWKCSKCHFSWKTETVARRGSAPGGCPACGNRVPPVVRLPLAYTHPDVFAEWAGNWRDPEKVHAASSAIVNWECSSCGLPWQGSPYERIFLGKSCPWCAKHRLHRV